MLGVDASSHVSQMATIRGLCNFRTHVSSAKFRKTDLTLTSKMLNGKGDNTDGFVPDSPGTPPGGVGRSAKAGGVFFQVCEALFEQKRKRRQSASADL